MSFLETRSPAAQADIHCETKDSPQLQLLQSLPSVVCTGAPRSQPAVGRLWTAARPGQDCAGSHRYQYRAGPVHQGTGTPWSQSELHISGAVQSTVGSRLSGAALFGSCLPVSAAAGRSWSVVAPSGAHGDRKRVSGAALRTRSVETPSRAHGDRKRAMVSAAWRRRWEAEGPRTLQSATRKFPELRICKPLSRSPQPNRSGKRDRRVYVCSGGKGDIGPSLG